MLFGEKKESPQKSWRRLPFGLRRKEGHTMASSFRIVMHENSENLHLRLIGDFDGSSAFELLDILKNRAHAVQKKCGIKPYCALDSI